MVEVVIRFFKLEVMSTHPMIYWGVGGVWLILLVAGFFSISSYSIPWWRKLLWALFILAFPILGLAIYAIRCLILADWSLLELITAKGAPSSNRKASLNQRTTEG